MRLSESLRRGMIKSFAGGIINRFKIKQRRNTLFFEDISANYIRKCEEMGYKSEMMEIGKTWGLLAAKTIIPETVKKLPPQLFSKVMELVWTNLGILEEFSLKRDGDTVTLITKNDSITRLIGANSFATGCFGGILSVYFNSELVPVRASQSVIASEYLYKITHSSINPEGKSKAEYDKQNTMIDKKGFTLEDAIKKKMFRLEKNRIYFRGKSLSNSENTVFHIIGNRNILLDTVPEISYQYFKGIVDKNAKDENKLLLIKVLLQTMGWGIVTIIRNRQTTAIEISQLPCGLQPEKENWAFLSGTLLGYMWIIDRQMKIKNLESRPRRIKIVFGR